jgi:hypothetical protein
MASVSDNAQGNKKPLIREFARRVFEPRTGDERLDALRLVLSSKEPVKIDGAFVEYHWARMILQLYDTLDAEARTRLAETQVARIPDLIDEWASGRKRDPSSS